MIKKFFLCKNLTTTTKGEDVFNTVSHFLHNNGMDWHRVQQVSVDSSPAMMGSQRSFKGFVKRENASIQSITAPFISIHSHPRHCQLP